MSVCSSNLEGLWGGRGRKFKSCHSDQQKRQFSTEGCRFSFKAKICFVNVSQIRKPMLIQGRLSFFAKKALNFETAEKVNKH